MKKILLLLIFSCFTAGWSQSHNFLVKDNNLLWENVFITNESNIPELISRHPRLKITSAEGSVYKGEGFEIRHTCPESSSFMNNDFSFDFEIEVTEGKYRVTILNIVYKKNANSTKSVNAEKYLVNKGAVKNDSETINNLSCLESYFNKIFSITMIYKNKS